MRRKTLLISAAVLLSLVSVVVAVFLMVTYEPSFYRAKAIDADPWRTKQSQAFMSNVAMLLDGINNHREKWGAQFTEKQINSYLAEGFVDQGVAAISTLPEGISDPRVAVDEGMVRLGFRYGNAPWSTVISINCRVWMAPKESNAVVLQLDGVYAGAIPISSKLVMETITKVIRNQNRNVEVTWYRHDGKLTALLRFGGSRPRPTHQLQQLSLGQGMLVLQGRSVPDPLPHVSTAP